MLELKNISKQYKTGDLVQNALDDISLSFRDSEFVAVLGPSGSGKTTLLNILGGLDRYTTGDLLINGISTKQFKDRDWDSYRNHSVGFVFQNYQLIMHQTVLENVELALSISGISGAERRKRAEQALIEVGLEEHLHKKPSQLSGGQMQRVAIARALVNEPDIVLADEPTGALDSTTSIQVMDLLKAVAKDRLVIMVTHNPELAKTYATRIVKIRDGKIYEDSMPYDPEKAEQTVAQKKPERVSMSFLTALTLSFNNLRTKKARTLLVSFAGSIGIIGIALILALSSGVNSYIKEQEEETLSAYPVQIEKTGYNLTTLMSSRNSAANPDTRSENTETTKKDKVGVNNMTDTIFNGVSNNDLSSMKTFLDDGGDGIEEYTNGIEYRYDITPMIYSVDSSGEARQVNPNNMFTSLATGKMDISSMMSGTMGNDFFELLPSVKNLYEDTYDVKAGRWPEKSNELVLILSADGKVSDLVLYAMNLKNETELETKVKDFSEGKTVASSSEDSGDTEEWYDYDDFLGKTFRLVYNSEFYQYDSEYNIWIDKSDDETFVDRLVPDGRELTITGIVQPKEETNVSILQDGIGYTDLLIKDIMQEAAGSQIVRDQIANPEKNVLTGKTFSEDNSEDGIDFTKLFQVDEDALKDAFQNSFDTSGFDASGLNLDTDNLEDLFSSGSFDTDSLNLGDMIDPSQLSSAIPSMSADNLSGLLSEVKLNISADEMEQLFRKLLDGYLASVQDDPTANPAGLSDALQSYLKSAEFRQLLQDEFQKTISGIEPVSREDVQNFLNEILSGYPQYISDHQLDANDFRNNLNAYLSDEETRQKMENAASELTGRLKDISLSEDRLKEIGTDLLAGYNNYAKANSMPDVESISNGFRNYLSGDSAKQLIMQSVSGMIDTGELEQKIAEMFQSSMQSLSSEVGKQISNALSAVMQSMSSEIAKSMNAAMTQVMSQLQDQMGSMFQIDPSVLAEAIRINMSSGEIQDLLSSLMQTQESTYDSNLSEMGYADLSNPSSIYIYPKDFESKQEITNIISDYNDRMKETGHEDRVIVYTDMMATLMSSITRMINTISYVLIAFVAISLVVSSIMIGVITYISVLERKNEIGILRAVGASKRNVGEVFNAETFIIGLLAGIMGVVLTLILLFPTNALIASYTQQNDIHAYLKPIHALLLILLSTGLTMLAGIMPSRKAAKSDPVAALRSE